MLSFAFNVRMPEKLHMDVHILHACFIRVFLTALLEYIDLLNHYLCESFSASCVAITLYFTHSFCPATLNSVLGSCLQKSKFYGRVVPEPLGTPLPTPLRLCMQLHLTSLQHITKLLIFLYITYHRNQLQSRSYYRHR